MAECVMAELLRQAGRTDFAVASAATSTEELGNPLHRGAARALTAAGIPLRPHRARQVTHADTAAYDLFVVMDEANRRNLQRLLGEGIRIARLLDFTRTPRDIADPWYTGDFDTALRDIQHGCHALLTWLETQ